MTRLPTPAFPPRARRGFALIDAVIAMLLAAVGLLAMAATFMHLSRSEDIARQRSEALRLLVDRVEALRAYTQITAGAAGSGVVSWNSLASGTDTVTTNADFVRTWTLRGALTDPMRTLEVNMRWTDRSNEVQTFSMSTVVSRTDPLDVGLLGFPLPGNTTLKQPKNRNINIPVQAADLGNGSSAFRMPGTNIAVLFSNETGFVVKQCSVAAAVVTIALANLSGCTDTTAYILAGYIARHSISSFPSGLAINTGALTGLSGAPTCSVSDATDQNTGAAISGYKYYICVLNMPASGAAWSGRARLAATDLHTGSNDRLVCRFQYPAASATSANLRNVQPYSQVAESLDSQNYVITDNSSCPTVDALLTTQHQDCRSGNATRAADCPAS